MNAIDFSCKHDILIRHKDGTLTPMDEPYYEVEKIAPDTWKIMSSGDYHYLVAGDDEGIAIDTGYGAGNLREFLEELCGKPVRKVINTHHHFDHTANNSYFDLAYMAEESVELACRPYPSFDGIEFPRDYAVQIVTDGEIIPLAGRELPVFKIGDHTAGGIAILDPRERLLFTGDEIMPEGKMIGGTVEKFARDMEKLMLHRDAFDRVCGGPEMLPGEQVEMFYEAANKILAGEQSPAEPRKPRGPFHKDEGSEGQKIYDCQHPHPEDVPGGPGKGGPEGPKPLQLGDMGEFVYKGLRFGYRKDKLRDS